MKRLARFLIKYSATVYVLLLINGFLLASLIYFRIEDVYERNIFNAISQRIMLNNPVTITNKDSFFIKAMDLANNLQQNRQVVFGGLEMNETKAIFLHSAVDDLITGKGACGSASAILARILKSYNYKTRLAQMKVGDIWGGHIVTEVKKGDGWIVLDPLLRCYFKKPDGTLASFNDVQHNWEYYSKQVPKDYKMEYKYEDVRYTNWDRIGIAGKMLKGCIKLFYGEQAVREFSLLSYLLRNFHALYILSIILYLFESILLTIMIFKRRKYLNLLAAL